MTKTTVVLSVPGEQVTATLGGAEVPGSRRSHSFDGQNVIRQEIDADLLALQLRLEYSLDDGESWDAICTTPIGNVNASTMSRWFTIPQEAKTEVLIRSMAVGLVSCRVRFISIEAE